MLTDAHCHPFDLQRVYPGAEQERRQLGVVCAASATDMEEFVYNEDLARKSAEDSAAKLMPCFAIHPQLPASMLESGRKYTKSEIRDGLETLENLAAQHRLAAIGETGFDLFNSSFTETEPLQNELFTGHLEIALRYNLPLIIHSRRAMHKIFSFSREMAKCKAVVFHSWPGTQGEGEALIRKGINAYFSFGAVITLNHREAMRSCTAFPAERLLFETDAPFQPPRGQVFSKWTDLSNIISAAAALRAGNAGLASLSPEALESQIEKNFYKVFSNENSETR